jgi:hypothetical protein
MENIKCFTLPFILFFFIIYSLINTEINQGVEKKLNNP